MKGLLVPTVVSLALAGILAIGCSSAAPTPTTAPKAPESTKATAPAAQPTAAPAAAPKVSFPEKGRAITFIVAWEAGGGTDVSARVLSVALEKELGTPVQVVNKPGAGGQVGITELAKSKGDGYTIGYTNLPATVSIYLDAERKPAFGRNDLQPLALHVLDPGAIAVKADSPYKNMKDLIGAAKANPEKVKAGLTGVTNPPHFALLQLERLTGVRLAPVQFNGGAPALTALLGGHVDVGFDHVGTFVTPMKTNQVRLLGVMDREESKFAPGVKTMSAQGIELYGSTARAISAPAGTPKEVVGILSSAIKRAMDAPEHKTKMEEMGLTVRYMDPAQLAAFWGEVDTQVKSLLQLAKR